VDEISKRAAVRYKHEICSVMHFFVWYANNGSMLLRNYTKQRHMFLVSCPSLIKMLPLHAAASFSTDVRSDLLIPAEVRVGHSAVSFIPFYSCTAEANCPILQVDIKLT